MHPTDPLLIGSCVVGFRRQRAVFVVPCAHPGWLQVERIPRSETPLRSGRTTAYDTTIVERPFPLVLLYTREKAVLAPYSSRKIAGALDIITNCPNGMRRSFVVFFMFAKKSN